MKEEGRKRLSKRKRESEYSMMVGERLIKRGGEVGERKKESVMERGVEIERRKKGECE